MADRFRSLPMMSGLYKLMLRWVKNKSHFNASTEEWKHFIETLEKAPFIGESQSAEETCATEDSELQKKAIDLLDRQLKVIMSQDLERPLPTNYVVSLLTSYFPMAFNYRASGHEQREASLNNYYEVSQTIRGILGWTLDEAIRGVDDFESMAKQAKDYEFVTKFALDLAFEEHNKKFPKLLVPPHWTGEC